MKRRFANGRVNSPSPTLANYFCTGDALVLTLWPVTSAAGQLVGSAVGRAQRAADLERQVCVTMLRQLAHVERRTPAAARLI